MKKRMKLLALALAVVMLLPVSALAAESEAGEEANQALWMQWINWDEENYQPDGEVHQSTPQTTPYDTLHLALYVCEDGKDPAPVPADQLTASEGLSVRALAPGQKGKESYIEVDCTKCEWNKNYTISYGDYRFTIECRLPDIGLYKGPQATTGNYLTNWWGFTPLVKENTVYVISSATDTTRGRHMTGLALAEDNPGSDYFTLEKISDDVYQFTMKDTDIDILQVRLNATWQNVSFMGGGSYTEEFSFTAAEKASVIFSEKKMELGDDARYDDLKADFTNELTLAAGESKTVYGAFTYCPGEEQKYWVVRSLNGNGLEHDDALKVTVDPDDVTKMTISSDVPGTYSLVYYDTFYPEIDALYHADGTRYTEDELNQWVMDTPYMPTYENGGGLLIITDLDNWETAAFEEAFPGEKIAYHMVRDDPWHTATVTVTGATSNLAFTDVDADEWYVPAIRYVSSNGIMTGNPDGTFNPDGQIQSQEFAQLLYNRDSKPAAAEGAAFQGVTDQWYAPAVLWAAGKGILTDTGDTAVAMEQDLTRQQIAVILYNYMGKPAGTADLSVFADAGEVSGWAQDAIQWAVSAKIFNGSDEGGKLYLNPTDTAKRCETAQLLMNFFG